MKAAAHALSISEPAVSQALAALRQHLGDRLIERGPGGMTLTQGGARLLPIASQMVTLGAEAEAAVRAARGAPERLRVVATTTIAEFVTAPLIDAFSRRAGRDVEGSFGVAGTKEISALLANRLTDLALGPDLGSEAELVSEPVFRARLIVVGGPRSPRATWLVDPSGADPGSDTSRLLRRLRIPENRIRVFPNQTAAWEAAAEGAGVAPAFAHLVAHQIRRGELSMVAVPGTPMEIRWHATTLGTDRRPALAGAFRRFLGTPEAMHLMRKPGAGIPPSRFRPPVYVTIWS